MRKQISEFVKEAVKCYPIHLVVIAVLLLIAVWMSIAQPAPIARGQEAAEETSQSHVILLPFVVCNGPGCGQVDVVATAVAATLTAMAPATRPQQARQPQRPPPRWQSALFSSLLDWT